MEAIIVLAPLLGAILIGAISPGPSFVLVARTAIAVSRLDGLAAATGMGLGASVFAAAALAGLHAVLTSVPALYTAVKIVGAAYLLYLAIMLWRGANDPIKVSDAVTVHRSIWKSFSLGLATQLSNPKTAVVYASMFAALLPPHQSWSSRVLTVCLICMLETGWYAVVAVAFSSARQRNRYLRSKAWIDRTAAGVMGLLGGKLIFELRD
jgi:threonine/homoserine/homoserine lactone efflux protein